MALPITKTQLQITKDARRYARYTLQIFRFVDKLEYDHTGLYPINWVTYRRIMVQYWKFSFLQLHQEWQIARIVMNQYHDKSAGMKRFNAATKRMKNAYEVYVSYAEQVKADAIIRNSSNIIRMRDCL